jgi:hypothetical protein
MPYCYLIQYCTSNTVIDIARIYKVSESHAGIKYKFGIQVPKGTENSIKLNNKNLYQLWEKTIKTELKVLDSGEDIPTGYQKFSYHMIFDVKYDLRHNARLVACGNGAVNDKEDIYSGVVRMDTVKTDSFLRDLYELSCCAYNIGTFFLYGKKECQIYTVKA